MPEPRLWTWRRLVAVTLAKALLSALVGLAAWGALPAALGWHPTTVSSGSMMPRLHVGDVAVSRPLGVGVPPLTSVLLFDDPDHHGRLRMHRFVRVDENGMLVTRGDANPADDSSPVALSAVRGIGTLRVPWVALPIVWLREGQWLRLGLVAGVLTLLLGVATSSRDRGFGDDEDQPGPPDGTADPTPEGTAAGTAPSEVETGATEPPAQNRTSAAPVVRVALRHPGLRRGAALLGATLLALAVATPAQARFADTTTGDASLTAARWFSCANATAALDPALWYRMDETSSTDHGRHGQLRRRADRRLRLGRQDHDDGPGLRARLRAGDDVQRLERLPELARRRGGHAVVFTLSIWFRTHDRVRRQAHRLRQRTDGGLRQLRPAHLHGQLGPSLFGVYADAVRTVTHPPAVQRRCLAPRHGLALLGRPPPLRRRRPGRLRPHGTTRPSRAPGVPTGRLRQPRQLDQHADQPLLRRHARRRGLLPSALTAAQVDALHESGRS